MIQNVGSQPKKIRTVAYAPDGVGFGFECLDCSDGTVGLDPPKPPPAGKADGDIVLEPGKTYCREVALDPWTRRDTGRSVTAVPGFYSVLGFHCPAKPDPGGLCPGKIHSLPVALEIRAK